MAVEISFIFGDDFNISLASSTDYAISIFSNVIKFSTTLNALKIVPFTIKSILTPTSSPSLPVYASISI